MPGGCPCRRASPRTWGQAEEPVKPHVVYYHAALLAFRPAQPAPHLLQVLGERERGPGQLHEAHVGAVEALAEHVYVHEHAHPATPEVLHQPRPPGGGRLAVYRGGAYPPGVVVCGDVPRVGYAHGVDDALPAAGVPLHALAEPFYRRPAVERGLHLTHEEVTVGTAPFQAIDNPLLVAALPYRYVIEGRQPAVADEARHAAGAHKRVEQVGEAAPAKPARRGRHAEELRLRAAVVRLVYHDQPRPFAYLAEVARQPLDGIYGDWVSSLKF